MVLCDGGPPTMERLGALDQGADPRAQLAVGPIGGDQTNSFIPCSGGREQWRLLCVGQAHGEEYVARAHLGEAGDGSQ